MNHFFNTSPFGDNNITGYSVTPISDGKTTNGTTKNPPVRSDLQGEHMGISFMFFVTSLADTPHPNSRYTPDIVAKIFTIIFTLTSGLF